MIFLAPIPKIEAAVPSTVLADMFGKATADVIRRLDLSSNGWMHYTNAAKGIFGAFANTAPKLAPCLGLLGVGFGFINKELNSVSPAQIMKEVNKAIDQVVEQTNRRFEVMEEYVDQTVRELMKEAMNDHYKGQFESWNECIELPTKDMVNECQRYTARAMNTLKYQFLFQNKFPQEGDLPKADIKALELQLPILKKWADFHFLVLAALMKTYKDDDGEVGKVMYEKYKSDFTEVANLYITYMEWALIKIRKSRIEDNTKTPSLDCKGFNDDTGLKWSMPTNKHLKKTSRRCSFKCDNMRPDYCDLTSTEDCTTASNGHCKLCSGLICSTTSALNSYHQDLARYQLTKSKEICNNYISRLTQQMDAFWQREVEVFLPIFKEILTELDEEPEGEEDDGAHKRQADKPDDGSGEELSDEMKKWINQLNILAKEKDQDVKNALKGISEKQSLAEYLKKVITNSKPLLNEMQAERKKLKKRKQANH